MTRNTTGKLTAAIAIVVGALSAYFFFSAGATSGPSDDAIRTDGSTSEGQAQASAKEKPALVNRILDGLGKGRSAKSFDNPVTGADVPVIKSASNVPVASLEVPKLGLRTPLFEGVHQKVIDRGPGHWPGTPLPGQPGNSVISGHRATHGAEFAELDDLRPGDPIRVRIGGQDRSITFRVQKTSIVLEEQYVDFVTAQPSSPAARVLTLFACNPVYDSTHRIVVRAVAAPAAAESG